MKTNMRALDDIPLSFLHYGMCRELQQNGSHNRCLKDVEENSIPFAHNTVVWMSAVI